MLEISFDELNAYSAEERGKWRTWLLANGRAMRIPIHTSGRFRTVGHLIDHIFLVERRHYERLMNRPVITDATGVAPTDVAGQFAFAATTRDALVDYVGSLSNADAAAERSFGVRGQTFQMTPRKLAFHILVHEVRHWAQIALAVRNAGLEPPGNHDLFFSGALK